MSVIDQAFVKAYRRRTEATGSTASPTGADVSVHPDAAQAAVMWLDPTADLLLRVDGPAKTSFEGGPAIREPAMLRRTAAETPREPLPEQSNRVSPALETSDSSKPSHHDAVVDHVAQVIVELPTDRVEFATEASIIVQENWNAVLLEALTPEQSTVLKESNGTAPDHEVPRDSDAVAMPAESTAPIREPAIREGADRNQPRDQPLRVAEGTPQGVSNGEFKAFTAVWEVDAFEFSGVIAKLFGDASLMRSIGYPLDRAVSEGLQSLLVTSEARDAGRTSVATGIAVAAAAAGLRVVLVDATFLCAGSLWNTLADSLNLEVQYGWLEAIRGGISVAETAVHSIEDQLTVLPLVQSPNLVPPTATEFDRMLRSLRHSFDLIVIDGTPLSEPSAEAMISVTAVPSGQSLDSLPMIDAAILVQDCRRSSAAGTARALQTFKRLGIAGLGLVDNFDS